MTERQIDKLVKSIYKQRPWIYRTDITAILEMLNKNKMLHPPHDDTFLWDKDIVEQEYPNVVAQIRKEEREKVISEIKEKISEVIK